MLSIPKLIVLILIGIAGWYLYKTIKRRGLDGFFRSDSAAAAPKSSEPKALDMEKCRICGDFVPSDGRACAQARCPYPQA